MREDGGRTRDAEQKTHIVMWGIRRPKKKSKIAPSVPCQKLVGFKSLRLAKVGPLCERKWICGASSLLVSGSERQQLNMVVGGFRRHEPVPTDSYGL
jgi:hypothetical protein